MDENELCPFCGGHGASHKDNFDQWIIYCESCDAQTGRYATREAAVAAWNRRASTDAVTAQNKRLCSQNTILASLAGIAAGRAKSLMAEQLVLLQRLAIYERLEPVVLARLARWAYEADDERIEALLDDVRTGLGLKDKEA